MDHQARSFFDLALNVIDTYKTGCRDVLRLKKVLSETDVKRIEEAINEYAPLLRTKFVGVCEKKCEAYEIAERVETEISFASAGDVRLRITSITDFMAALLKHRHSVEGRMFLLSLSDTSTDYRTRSAQGRLIIDERVGQFLDRFLGSGDKALFIGAGVFLLLFVGGTTEEARTRKDKVLDMLWAFLGIRKEDQSRGDGVRREELSSSVTDATDGGFDLGKRLAAVSAAKPGGPDSSDEGDGHGSDNRSEQKGSLLRKEVLADFWPVWDSQTGSVRLSLLVPKRITVDKEILYGEQALPGRDVLELRSYFEWWKLETAVASLSEFRGRFGDLTRCPGVIFDFSLRNLGRMSISDFEEKIDERVISDLSGQLFVCLKDVDESLPRRFIDKLVAALAKRGMGLLTKTSFGHPYLEIMERHQPTTLVLDNVDVQMLGFDDANAERIIVEFARSSRVRRSEALITNVHQTKLASAVLRAGFRYVCGKVIDVPDRALKQVHDLSSSAIMMRL